MWDSHVHLLATGLVETGLHLRGLASIEDVGRLEIKDSYFRGPFLTGFGWDQNLWPGKAFPTRQDLDRFFPEIPVIFTRVDGHASWLNTSAILRLGVAEENFLASHSPQQVPRDSQNFPTGLVFENAKIELDLKIPAPSRPQKKQALGHASLVFKSLGFDGIRDMSGDLEQWELLHELHQEDRLPLRVWQNWTLESLESASRLLPLVLERRRARNSAPIHSLGFKLYLDGALGSEGAFLSQNYQGRNHRGQFLWDLQRFAEVMEMSFRHSLPIALHCIGDATADLIADTALALQKRGIHGSLHLEHAQIVRPETLVKLSQLAEVHAHMQPCHYLSDRSWLADKIGPLMSWAFPWRALQEAGVQVHFGSDSPIEAPGRERNLEALHLAAAEGIPLPLDTEKAFQSPY